MAEHPDDDTADAQVEEPNPEEIDWAVEMWPVPTSTSDQKDKNDDLPSR